jgi:hypothetical protein
MLRDEKGGVVRKVNGEAREEEALDATYILWCVVAAAQVHQVAKVDRVDDLFVLYSD